ncbi:radical SAM family heme chaperone HemW [Terricaulis sp.]|uniref:radical SAM family heme chaperone HemW n=1 Tax=Terricaulis sp. TaxID=2768686 RepID=UPI002AC48FC4|nr:radical SAM family heme chaperone HemW [Terricaulis sp.]MDZ4691145.1 radical SAM family heme chaperone HemW [Terricaulis sp.]
MNVTGIYVHWPYCATICPYCDFNVYRARGADNAPLLDAIIADMEAHAQRFGRRTATSLFLGGGTPSLLRGGEIARLIDAASQAFVLAADCEITLEANPEDAALFDEHAAAGVNRFSIGAQAFDDAALKALGRRHNADAGLRAVEAAARTDQRVSLDLIYAREGQTLDQWREELVSALALPIEHVSLYQLTIEAETAFARRVERGQLTPPDIETAASLYELTQEICAAAGFAAYEISNHARDAGARSRHNQVYWRGQDWIGIGPGAHGRVSRDGARLAFEAQRRPADYIDAVRENGVGWITDSVLTGEETADETLLMGLRLDEGVDVERIAALRGRPINPQAIEWLAEQGFITFDGGRVTLTARGRIVANSVAAELAA